MLKLLDHGNETERLFADLDRPSLHSLSYALRHPDTWPADFSWNYDHCSRCAMGLAHRLWNSIPQAHGKNGTDVMARSFAMPWDEAQRIFMNGWWSLRRHAIFRPVTPEMVADRIDAYLVRVE